jgi:SAM-dependent methyltransferase
VADLGCGPGSDGARFAGEGYRVVGMDLSAGMLAIAARRLDGRVTQADLRRLPLVSGRLDGIWCVAALLHVPEDDTDQCCASSGAPCDPQVCWPWSPLLVTPLSSRTFLTPLESGAGSCIEVQACSASNRGWLAGVFALRAGCLGFPP